MGKIKINVEEIEKLKRQVELFTYVREDIVSNSHQIRAVRELIKPGPCEDTLMDIAYGIEEAIEDANNSFTYIVKCYNELAEFFQECIDV